MNSNHRHIDCELSQLDHADLVHAVELIATTGDPRVELDIMARRRLLAQGLAALVDADVFFWSLAYAHPDVPGDAMPSAFVDGGWRDDQQRCQFMHFLTHSELSRKGTEFATAKVYSGTACTVMRSQIFADDEWKEVAQEYFDQGFGDYLLSLHPLNDGGFSCLGLHRAFGKPAFDDRHRAIVHLVFQSIKWIHRDRVSVEVCKESVQLSPREREVLLMLMRGDSPKNVAMRLGISQHTVNDYLKKIYRHFGVKTRAELMGRFLSGN